MKERAAFIKHAVNNGVYDLNYIIDSYNKLDDGGGLNQEDKSIDVIYDKPDIPVLDAEKYIGTRLIEISTGVYKDTVSGKILRDYAKMPTAVVTAYRDRSINGNLQRAYAKGIPSGTMRPDMDTFNAVTGGVFNLISPTQVMGAIGRLISNGDSNKFGKNLILGNHGIVSDNFAKEHPYWSMAANGLFDGVAFGATSILKNPQKLSSIVTRDLKNLPNSENLMYHLDFGNNVGAFSKNGAFIKDGLLYPGAAKDINQKSFIWFNKGKPYTTSIGGKKLNRAIIANEDDINGLLKVRDSTEPIGQWNGSSGFVLPSEYVTDIPFNTNKGLIYNRKQLPLIGEFWLRDFRYAKGGPIKNQIRQPKQRDRRIWLTI